MRKETVRSWVLEELCSGIDRICTPPCKEAQFAEVAGDACSFLVDSVAGRYMKRDAAQSDVAEANLAWEKQAKVSNIPKRRRRSGRS